MGGGMGSGRGLGMGMGGGMGMGAGIGMGVRPETKDERDFKRERVRGRLSGKGEINEVKNFKGLPKDGEARLQLREVIRSAAQDAEDALGREEIPRKRREAVQRYFEELKPR